MTLMARLGLAGRPVGRHRHRGPGPDGGGVHPGGRGDPDRADRRGRPAAWPGGARILGVIYLKDTVKPGTAADETGRDLTGRFGPIVLALARAGARAGARVQARTRATLDTAGPTFVAFLLGVIVIVGGLLYVPMLIPGPIGERIAG